MLVLRSESAPAGVTTISIASGSPTPSGPTAVAPAAFRVSPQDAEELADILSVGSRIVIRRSDAVCGWLSVIRRFGTTETFPDAAQSDDGHLTDVRPRCT